MTDGKQSDGKKEPRRRKESSERRKEEPRRRIEIRVTERRAEVTDRNQSDGKNSHNRG
ncbi:hypothetical protein ACIQ7N_09495 [Lysinibacillus sp. NPDC095746]|uniref:hypothetical protein n=1 Tax=Lysinibacillus sp. NPDC095746 TaxID=3364134 RepID=UPI0037F9979A